MAAITCDEAETLINEAAPFGCRSPWEVELGKLALENRIASLLAGGVAGRGTYRTITATGNVVSGDYLLLCNATAGAITVTLPPVGLVAGRIYSFKKTDASANAVTIDGYGSETIDGATTKSLASQYKALTIMSDGTTWWILNSF